MAAAAPVRARAATPSAPVEGVVAWHALAAEDALARLESAPGGLSEAEAARRLARWGPNALRAVPPASAWKILLAQLRSFVVLLLVVAAALALATGDALDAAAIVVVLLINTVLGFVMELRARRTMEGLQQLEVARATVLRGGARREIGAESIVPGDVVVVEAGTRVPADARLLSGSELRTDEAALTGESLPAEKDADSAVPAETPVADRRTMVYRATLAVSGHALAVVVATGMRTEVGRIGALVGGVEEEPAPLERRLDALGRRLGWVAVAAAALVAVMGALRGTPAALAVETAIALAIAAVPEGLPAVATIALAVGVRRMARRHALVRRLPSVEALGSATVVCTDKTGTLTAGEMTVTRVWAGGREHAVTGAGYGPEGAILDGGEEVRPGEGGPLHAVLRIGALANRADVEADGAGWRVHGDPTEATLLVLARKAGMDRAALLRAAPEVGEVPFSSERMWMATFHRGASGTEVLVKGAPSEVLNRCTLLMTGAGPVPLDAERRRAVLAWNEAAAAQGLRVLALASATGLRTTREAEVDGLVLAGLVGMMDPPAAGVMETIAELRGAGLRTVMITGDQRPTAVAVARDLGLLGDGDQALEGTEIDRLDNAELRARAGRVGVYSRVSPEAKLRIVTALRSGGQVVAMLGDGVNDAAALKRADIGVAMGIRGTDMAREAAGIVLQDDRFPTVAAAVEEGRIVFDNIRKFVFYLFSCNAAEVLVLLVAGAAGLPLPLLPLQILWMNIVTDTFPALALAVEPGEKDVMRRPPRDPHAAILSHRFLLGVGFYGAMMTAATLAAFLWGLRGGDAVLATTLSFTTLSLAQILHLGNARSRGAVLGLRAATANAFALGAVALTLGLQVLALYLPPLQRLLELVPLGAAEWMVVLPLTAAPAVVGQLLKWRRGRPHPAA
ncbi:MAG TPA: HAD-IC family P-type ATPase [Longimicrobium sp.]|nr:HAD-IC family P-type ATPase [Longimicrobium sp.]